MEIMGNILLKVGTANLHLHVPIPRNVLLDHEVPGIIFNRSRNNELHKIT